VFKIGLTIDNLSKSLNSSIIPGKMAYELSHVKLKEVGKLGPVVELSSYHRSPLAIFCIQVFFDYVPSSAASLLSSADTRPGPPTPSSFEKG